MQYSFLDQSLIDYLFDMQQMKREASETIENSNFDNKKQKLQTESKTLCLYLINFKSFMNAFLASTIHAERFIN